MRIGILIILTITLTNLTIAQKCNCTDDFEWLKETFEKNDAGFQYVIDQKGEAEYKKHCDNYTERVKSITDKGECAETLLNWLRFFRKGHLFISLNTQIQSTESEQLDTEKIKSQYKNWETYDYKEKKFNNYLSKIKDNNFEGIWYLPPYKIGIRKVENEYIGFIIEADGIYWSKSQVKFKIRDDNGILNATYYMQDHSAREIKSIELLGNNYLQMDFVTLKRLTPSFPADKHLDMYFNFLTTDVPIFEKLTDNTAILRIPSFSHSEKKLIDSIIESNKDIILNTENLIIDLRYNGGGSDESFEKLLPIICTNPIRTIGVELLSTPLNNQRMVDIMNDPDFTDEEKKWAKEALEKLNKRIGEFVNVEDPAITVETFDTIYPYPKNVGIIINEGNGSTTEQFLLAAKQSKKVKLFGTTTVGVLDISNMYFIESPCKDLRLGYSLSRSKRIPDFTIDDKGIQPDFYIDKSIPQYDWIDYVNKILSNEF